MSRSQASIRKGKPDASEWESTWDGKPRPTGRTHDLRVWPQHGGRSIQIVLCCRNMGFRCIFLPTGRLSSLLMSRPACAFWNLLRVRTMAWLPGTVTGDQMLGSTGDLEKARFREATFRSEMAHITAGAPLYLTDKTWFLGQKDSKTTLPCAHPQRGASGAPLRARPQGDEPRLSLMLRALVARDGGPSP